MILLNYLRFLVGFMKKARNEQNFGQCWGSFAAVKGPLAAAKVHTTAWPNGEFGHSRVRRSEELLRGEATIHSNEKCCVLLCSAISLFQGLVY